MGIIHIGIFLLQRNITTVSYDPLPIPEATAIGYAKQLFKVNKFISETMNNNIVCTLMALKPLLIPNNNYFVFYHHNYYNLQYV